MVRQPSRSSSLAAAAPARRVHHAGRTTPDGKAEDPFFATFFSRIPEEIAASFTASELDAIKLAFGARVRGAHAIEVRTSLPLGRRRGYLILLAGLGRQAASRLSQQLFRPLRRFGNRVAIALFVLLFAMSLFAVAYVGKRWAGWDILPGIDLLNDRQMERALH